jgi:hypothetical protein
MTRLFEHRPPETPWYWVALFYAVNIIAAGTSVGLVIYYAL